MTRIGHPAIAAAVALVLAGIPTWADADPARSIWSENDLLTPVDDAELAAANGRGLATAPTSMNDEPQSPLAVILWDETKPPIVPASGLFSVEQPGRQVVISVGAGPANGR